MRPTNTSPREIVYEDKYQQIYRVTADFGLYSKQYFVREAGVRAGIIATRGDSVLLVEQYRFLIDRPALEIPGGKVDDGESPEDAATRECLEETGFRCHNPRPVIFYHPGLDTTFNPTYLFHSDEINKMVEPLAVNQREVIGYQWVPLSRCIKMIFDGQILDAFSIIALLAYQSKIKGQ